MSAKGCDGATLRSIRTLFEAGTAGGLSDSELLDRARLGSGEAAERAFALLVERHGPMVLRTCRGMLGDLESARDAFQDTFVVLARRAGTIRARESLGPWLHRVAVHVSKRRRDAEVRRRRHERRRAERAPTRSATPPTMPDDTAAILHSEIARLPERLRAPLVLCDLEGLSIEQAADRLGHPAGTIKSRRSRARDRLRGRLIGRGLAPAAALAAASEAIATAPSALPIGWAGAAAQAAMTPGLSTFEGILHGGFQVLLLHKFKALAVGCAVAGLGAFGSALPGTEPGSDGPAAGVAGAGADRPAVEPALGPDRPVAVPPEGPVAGASEPPLLGLPFSDPLPSRPLLADEPVLLDPIPPIGAANEPIRGPALLVAEPPIEAEPPPLNLGDPTPRRDAFNGNPAPWATVVRIKVQERGPLGFGSGTVISSTPEESIVLTCAHIFHVKGPQPRPDQFKPTVLVELFDGRLGDPGGQTVRPLGRPMAGEVIDYDFGRDVALVRIKPGRVVPASPIVPEGWSPETRMRMCTVGCTNGEDATAWSTIVTSPSFTGLSEKPNYEAIQCLHSPKQGRSGGGLFTEDGDVAGVCNYAFDPRVARGLYAAPKSIYAVLDRNNLSFLYTIDIPGRRDVHQVAMEELFQRASILVERGLWDEAESTLHELKSRAQGALESDEAKRRAIRRTLETAEADLQALDAKIAEMDTPGFEREAEAMLRSIERGRRSDPGPVGSLPPVSSRRDQVIQFAPIIPLIRDGHEPRPIGEIRDEVDAAFDEGAVAVRLGIEAKIPGGGRLEVDLRVTDPSQVDEAVDLLQFMNGAGPIAIDRREDGPIPGRPD